MKITTTQFLFILFFLLTHFTSSAQIEMNRLALVGLNFGTEYLHKNGINASPSQTFGIFAQFPLFGKISSHSSFFYGQRTYKVLQENSDVIFFSSNPSTSSFFTGNPLRIESTFRENAWIFDQFFKIHFPTGKIKCFMGLGVFIKMPLSSYGITTTQFNTTPSRIESFKYDASDLPRTWGFNFGGGGEILFQKNYVISLQFGLSLYDLDNIRFYQVPGYDWTSINSDAHNIYLKIGVGYIFEKNEKRPKRLSFSL